MSPEHTHDVPPETFLERPAWEQRYGAAEAVWSGRANPQLVAEAADLTPGRAMDVGCGEGADAIWLARRGWQVTAVDFARTGLTRAEQHARRAGPEIAERITWVRADVRDGLPGGRYDLVSAQYFHLPPEPRADLFGRLAEAVAPDGTLLFVAHHPFDLETVGRRFPADMFVTAEDLAGTLDPGTWEVLVAEARARTVTVPDRGELTIHDAVLRARRRPHTPAVGSPGPGG